MERQSKLALAAPNWPQSRLAAIRGAARRRHARPLVGCGGSRVRLPPVAAARFGQLNSRSLSSWRRQRGAGRTAATAKRAQRNHQRAPERGLTGRSTPTRYGKPCKAGLRQLYYRRRPALQGLPPRSGLTPTLGLLLSNEVRAPRASPHTRLGLLAPSASVASSGLFRRCVHVLALRPLSFSRRRHCCGSNGWPCGNARQAPGTTPTRSGSHAAGALGALRGQA